MANADDKEEKGCCEKFAQGLSNFSNFLYNKETGQVLGRSGKSWAKIGFFYLIFYGFLAGFFSGMLAVFLSTLNEPGKGGPKLTQYIANQPGLTRVGYFDFKKYNRTKDSKDIKGYNTTVMAHLAKYNNGKAACPNTTSESGMPKDQDCTFNTTLLGECAGSNLVPGLIDGTPCIYIRVNRVYDWVPKSKDNSGYLTLYCDNTDVKVTPVGFQISAFPYRGQGDDFELPVVALKFNATLIGKFDCWLVGKDIEVSETSVPSRAFGRIRIE